jgi:hypothetical protein
MAQTGAVRDTGVTRSGRVMAQQSRPSGLAHINELIMTVAAIALIISSITIAGLIAALFLLESQQNRKPHKTRSR